MPEILKLNTDEAFSNAVVPAGQLLIFYVLDTEGNIVKRYKDSNGNFGDM